MKDLKVARKIKKHIKENLGVDCDVKNWADITRDYQVGEKLCLDPEKCGPVKMIFESITCTVSYGMHEDSIYLRYDFKYEHPFGSNGYNLTVVI